MILVLIRHGETDFNAQGRMQGWLDVPLNAEGRLQAHTLAMRLADSAITHVYASPLIRAAYTAQVLADACRLSVKLDERLREFDMGEWQGRLISEIRAHQAANDGGEAGDASIEAEVPGGETAQQMRDRVDGFLETLLRTHRRGDRIAVVSHGGTLAAMLGGMLALPVRRRQPFTFGNATVTEVQRDGARWKLLTLNCSCPNP
jgi:broad specificity phosphatase PhoE